MSNCGPKVAAIKDRLRQFVDLSKQCEQSRALWELARTKEGGTIRELRTRLGLTLDEAGPLLGISKPYLSLIETGRCGITHEIVERVADLAERLERCEPERGRSLAEIATREVERVAR